MGKFKPVVTATVSSKGHIISTNYPQPALQCGQLSALCSWLTLVFDVVFFGSKSSWKNDCRHGWRTEQ